MMMDIIATEIAKVQDAAIKLKGSIARHVNTETIHEGIDEVLFNCAVVLSESELYGPNHNRYMTSELFCEFRVKLQNVAED